MIASATKCQSSGSPPSDADEAAFVRRWENEHGLYMHGDRLYRSLGFGSRRSFERAVKGGELSNVPLFTLATGRGKFARTGDVARYLWRRVQPRLR